MNDDRTAFPEGIVVFFRIMAQDGTLARSFHPSGRQVSIRNPMGHPEDYVVTDGAGNLLAVFPRDFVSAIMPVQTVGPGAPDANNPSIKSQH